MSTITHARVEDLPEIAELARVVWRSHYPGIISDAQIEYMLRWMYDLDTLTRELTREGVRFVRLLRDGRLVAFASFGPADQADTVKLHKLYVSPEHQRSGFGSELIGYVLEQARALGAKRLLLAVNKANAKAIAAYERNGFVVERSVRADIGGGFVMDDYLMVKAV